MDRDKLINDLSGGKGYKKCQICGSGFKHRSGNVMQKYCSRSCYFVAPKSEKAKAHGRKLGLLMKGKKHSEETRKKISIARTGPILDKVCTNCAAPFEVPVYYAEQKFCTFDCFADFQKGQNHPWWGKKHNAETIEKIRRTCTEHSVSFWQGKKRGPTPVEVRKKLSEATKGEKSHKWKGGATEKNALVRQGLEYRLWKEAVFERDNYVCQECGERGGDRHAHHVKAFSTHPELRFEVSNGITLCVPCHRKTDNFGTKAIKQSV